MIKVFLKFIFNIIFEIEYVSKMMMIVLIISKIVNILVFVILYEFIFIVLNWFFSLIVIYEEIENLFIMMILNFEINNI